MSEKVVNSQNYVGRERRDEKPDVIVIAHKNLTFIIAIVTLTGIAVSWGVSWQASKSQLDNKVNVSDQLRVDTRQDLERENLKFEVSGMKDGQLDMNKKLDQLLVRVTDIACEGKPKSCR